jgi:hypothetical protein
MQQSEAYLYHPGLLTIFSRQQLDLLVEHSMCNVNNDGQIYVLFSLMDFGSFEIYYDGEAEKLKSPIIYVKFDETEKGTRLNSEEFWGLYFKSIPLESIQISIDV